jgi:hypothetical protein
MTEKTGRAEHIELRLRELAQMFNSMDPSPFVTRDLDAAAEEFIVGWAEELAGTPELELVIRLATPPPAERAAGVAAAVQHYFAGRAERKQWEFHQLMRRGRWSLAIGLLCLATTLGISEILARLALGPTVEILRASLTIGGWVAMWRPMEIYLYDWWPILRELRLYQRLARMRVTLIPPEAGAVAG